VAAFPPYLNFASVAELDDIGTRQRLPESILIVEHYDQIAKSIGGRSD